MKPRSDLVSAVLLVALLGGATACGGSDDKNAKDGSSSSTSPGAVSSDGTTNVGVSKDLPKGFPSDVKIVGTFGKAITVSGTWTVKTTTSDSVGDSLKAAGKALTDEGFKAQIKPSDDGTRGTATYGNKTYYVQINAAKQKNKSTLLIYLVGKS